MESCTSKNPKVYLLQVYDPVNKKVEIEEFSEEIHVMGEETVAEDEGLEITIYAILECSNNNAMRLLGRIGSCAVEILVDSRSTHNFLDTIVVQEAKLKVQDDLNLQVRVANGDRLLSKGKCEELIGSEFIFMF